MAVWAKWLCRSRTRIVVREANTTSKEVAGCASNPFDRKWPIMMKEWYPRADRIVAISDGVACDLSRVSELPRERITTSMMLMSLHGGGIKRVFLYLARAFVSRGLRVEIIVVNPQGPFMKDIPEGVRIVTLERRGTDRDAKVPLMIRLLTLRADSAGSGINLSFQ